MEAPSLLQDDSSALPPLKTIKRWPPLMHSSAGGVTSELISVPGLEAALEVLQAPKFLQQLQASYHLQILISSTLLVKVSRRIRVKRPFRMSMKSEV